jgi:uncharacterized protein
MRNHSLLVVCAVVLVAGSLHGEQPKPIKILFLGDNGHHRPAERFRQLQPILAARGIDMTYTDKVEALNPKLLASYDGLIVYANTDAITPEQEKALLDYVEGGKGFIPLHCASYCFRNSAKYIDLVGAQFQRHDTGTFRTVLAEPNHPLMKDFRGFESWDETYTHAKHNEKDRTVLEYREEKGRKEPWTWVRTQGKGRVFYTAWGHDERTWGHPGFQNLVERGIRWAVGADPAVVPAYTDRPKMTILAKDVKPFEYIDVGGHIPDYKQGAGKTLSQMQRPLAPDESMKHMVHPADFELKLFASEEQLGGKPIAMNWDERGRLWVVVTVDYPNNIQPEGKGHDRILILEDAAGKGQADKVTVFADKLSIPTSLTFASGGVIVHQAPHTLLLRDTDGDDRADERKALFTGWRTSDTHAGPSNLRQGMDNWIYGIVGYSGFEGKVGEDAHKFGQGFYRFKPDGSKFEFLRSTSNNSWGVGFSEEGLLFGSTANGNPSVQMPIPNRYYEAVRGWSSSVLGTIADSDKFYPITDKIRQVDYHGRFTAAAGHALYTARTYPREYWNRAAFVTDPTGHLVSTFTLQPQGATFRSRNAWNLLASDDEWCAPIMAEVGPDGNVWVIDWYNYIVQHNPTPPGFQTGKGNAYQTELRDKKHGRIYRLAARDAKPTAPFTLKDATPEKLVAALKNDNMLWRNHAQRLLVERGKQDVVPALLELAGEKRVDEVGLNVGVMHALWTLHGLGALDGSNPKALAAAVAALQHKSAGVRRNAVGVLPRTAESIGAVIGAGLLKDADPQVRLAALLALADLPPARAGAEALVAALEDGSLVEDRWLADAYTSAAARHHVEFLPALARGWSKPLSPALVAVVSRAAEHQARRGEAQAVGPLVEALADGNAGVADAVVAGLVRGWPKDKAPALAESTEKALARLLAKLAPAARGQLVALSARWGSKALEKYAVEVVAALVAQVRNEKETEPNRIQAAAQLIDFRRGDADAARQLFALLTPQASPELGQGLLEALARSEAATTGPALVELLPSLTPGVKAAAVRALLGRTDWTTLLLDAAAKGTLHLTELTLDQRQGLTTHPNAKIAARARELLAKGGGLISPDRQKVIDELLPLTQKAGNPAAGKLVFKTHCTKCHTHSGEGARIGPDLTGMAVHPKNHLLIEIMDPSRSVEGNYRLYTVTTKSGRTLSGLLASESKTAIELIDVEAKKHTLLREDIEELLASKRSLMPDGFEKQLKPEEVVNLLEFLTTRGKYLPLPLDKAATVVSTRGMFYSEESEVERLIFPDWTPRTFQGVPFNLVDPQGDRVRNVILLHGPQGKIPPTMPKAVTVPCNAPARTIHLLSGVSGWGFPLGEKGSVSLIVRLHYDDGKTEEHELKNGEHFADYIRRVDVPGSTFAFALRGQQIRYIAVHPQRGEKIKEIEFVKGKDRTAPIVMAVTVEAPQ